MVKKIFAALFLCITATVFFSCGTTSSVESAPQVPADEKPKEEKQEKKESPKKKEFTKMDFMDELQKKLNTATPAEALTLFDTLLPQKYSEDFDILYLKASVCISAEFLDMAEEISKALTERDSSNPDVIALAATIAKLRGNNAERTKKINELLAVDKLNPDANIELGEDAFKRKNYKQALMYYKRALVKEPSNIDALWGVGQSDYFLERDEESKEFFNKIIAIDPRNANAYSYLGKLAYANNEYLIALNHVKKAIEIDPDNYQFHLNAGTYERCLGHYDNAITEWTKAIELEGDYFLAYAYRGGLYDETDNFEKALEDYLMVIKLNPKYYYAYESIGIVALHQKNWKTAREAFAKCYEFNKDNISYPLMITYCYYMEDNALEAKNFSDKVLRKMPDRNSIEYKVLRVFHDKAGEKGIPQQIAVLNSMNKRGKMYFYFALYCDMMGADSLAKEYYLKVIDMNSPMFFEYRLAEWAAK